MSYKILNSEEIYRGRAFNVRRDEVALPDGRSTRLDIVEHVGAVTILPLDADGCIWFVRQYRHPAGLEILELPAGTLDQDEFPEACAHREIREEIGMAAGRLEKLGEFYLAPGYSSEYMYVFLATELSHAPLEQDDDEFLRVDVIPLERVFEMARQGQINDAKTLAALYLFSSQNIPSVV
jgi:ADP-ribose pyrophosphatase